tara:strand:+ start:13148 stop:13369 length:222 start_codon:yes stop_codon:yes gene_type:complete
MSDVPIEKDETITALYCDKCNEMLETFARDTDPSVFSYTSIEHIIDNSTQKARIVVTCLRHDEEITSFLLANE